MKFCVQDDIFNKFPRVRLGVIVATGIDNTKSPVIFERLQKEIHSAKEQLSPVNLKEHPSIVPWREAHIQFGSNPNKFPPSVEALAKRVQKGGTLPDINPLVNAYNALSLMYLLPFGAEDLDKVKGDIRLGFAKGMETGKYIGNDEVVACDLGEVAYLDDLGFICRKWNWREGDRTKITPETTNAVIVVESFSEDTLQKAVEDLATLVKEELGGKTTVFYIDKQETEKEIAFDPGKKLTPEEQQPLVATKKEESSFKEVKIEKKEEIQKTYGGIAETIYLSLQRALRELGFSIDQIITLEHPAIEEQGDYSSNVALATFEQCRMQNAELRMKNPGEFGEEIIKQLNKDEELKDIVEKIEVAGPGFINFFLTEKALLGELIEIVNKKESYGKNNVGNSVKFSLEHTSPNTNKPLHIGHARNPILGMALVELLKSSGFSVVSTDINNDKGTPIMKSIWAYQKFGHGMTPETITREQWGTIAAKAKISNMEPYMIDGKIKSDHFVGLFYVVGHALSEEDAQVAEEIQKLVDQWEKGNEEIRSIWKQMNDWFYQGNKITLNRLDVYFDKEWYESEVYDKGREIVLDGVERGVFKKFPDGHVEAILEPCKMPNVVLLRKNGTALYITQDIELMRRRLIEDKNYYTYVQTSNEQNLRFRQLYKICELLGYGKAEQFIHLGYGVVRSLSGKMSSRLGNVILLDDLLDTMHKLAKGLMVDRNIGVDVGDSEKETIAEEVGIGALKYAMLKVNPLMNIEFDPEKSVSLEGDSGPYLQYTTVRCKSVIRNSELHNSHSPLSLPKADQPLADILQLNNEELAVVRWIYRFPEVVEQAARSYSPNIVCTFLFDLAQRYNRFYHEHSILKAEKEEQKEFRLLLTASVAQVLQNGLTLLGIKAPEKM